MAHAATLTGLAENLVTATTGLATNETPFSRLRDRTVRGLRDQTHARTNQFAVNASLDGLVEKFSVLNRDDLADGLKSRLEELPNDSKWMPEILSLLLELSDRPAEKTKLVDVANANKPPGQEHELTWDEIIAADPLNEAGIWESVERGYHSSGGEFDDEDDSDLTTSTTATSVDEQDPAAIARLHLILPSESALKEVKAARSVWQAHTSVNRSLGISELAVVRETFSMLRGLTTNLFYKDEATGRVSVSRKVSLNGISKSSLKDLLESAAATGRALLSLRRWTSNPQQLTYQRSMQASVQILMSTFDKRLAELERRYVAPRVDTVVSVLETLSEAQTAATSLMRISLLTQLSSMSMGSTALFALLDYLHDEVGIAQMAGDSILLTEVSSVLFAGLKTYLRSVSEWITAGSLTSVVDDTFFIRDAVSDCDKSDFWHSRYELRRQPDGTPIAPKCIVRFAKRIFALGKGRSFLSQLDTHSTFHIEEDFARFPDFASLRGTLELDTLMPFSHLLSECLETWISEISVDCTPILRSKILNDFGCSCAMSALPHVFFSRDGTLFQGFAESLLNRMKEPDASSNWNDQFLLTELAQTTLGASSEVNSENVYISLPGERSAALSITRKLEAVKIGHSFSWAIQNITGCSTPESHSRVFVLLLQLHYGATLIRGRFFDLRVDETGHSSVFRLRKSFLWFIDVFQNYVTTTAHKIHQEASLSFERADDIDGMGYVWADYVTRLQKTLLLTAALDPVRNAIIDILELNEALAMTTSSKGIAALQDKFGKSMRFLIAGIRGVSRAGGEPSLEVLAETLEWGFRGSKT